MSSTTPDKIALTLDRIVGRLAHDLRNPLAVVVSNLRYLAEQLSTPDLKEAAEESALAAEQLNALIEDASSIMPLRVGRLRPTPAELPLSELCSRIDRLLTPALGSKRLRWEVGDDGLLATDGRLVQRALSAVISHCVRRSPPGATITVRAERGDDLVLQVTDEGQPFHPDHEPSFLHEAVPESAAPEGDYRNDGGLGLYFAGVATRALGGQTGIKQRGDGHSGLEFELRIPLRRKTVEPA